MQDCVGPQDATNVSRILVAISERDVLIDANARLSSTPKRWAWMGEPGVVKWESWMSVPRGAGGGGGGGGSETKAKEWKLVEDAGGRMRAVKGDVEAGSRGNGEVVGLNEKEEKQDAVREVVVGKEEESKPEVGSHAVKGVDERVDKMSLGDGPAE